MNSAEYKYNALNSLHDETETLMKALVENPYRLRGGSSEAREIVQTALVSAYAKGEKNIIEGKLA